MFPPRSYRTAVEALLEVADALLRPLDELPLDAGQVPRSEHPHERAARVDRVRRPGGVAPRAQHCISPLAERPRAATRAAAMPSR